VRLIEINTRKKVDDVMSGSYKTHFKGHGVQFSEHRQYVAGDDIRHIDWKVSARTRDPLIKKFEEERELTVFLVVDVSGSKKFGSGTKLKSEIVAEIGGMLAYAASHSGDKVGVLFFADQVEKIIRPGKGRSHVQRVIRDLLGFEPKTHGTQLGKALDSTRRVMKHSGIIFILSDFMGTGYEKSLKHLSRKHDVIAIRLTDDREDSIPELGLLRLFDPETGEESIVDTSSYLFKKWIKENSIKRTQEAGNFLKSGKVDLLNIKTEEDYGQAVARFFKARSRRRG
jgi:uncharacterized protein (DUF58 family)